MLTLHITFILELPDLNAVGLLLGALALSWQGNLPFPPLNQFLRIFLQLWINLTSFDYCFK